MIIGYICKDGALYRKEKGWAAQERTGSLVVNGKGEIPVPADFDVDGYIASEQSKAARGRLYPADNFDLQRIRWYQEKGVHNLSEDQIREYQTLLAQQYQLIRGQK